MFEPIWNRNYVSCVQITMAEDFGVDDRGHFYDPVGAVRDVVVNHLMQVVAAAAMEPPATNDPSDAEGPHVRRVPLDARRRPRASTCAGSTRATGRSTVSRRTRRRRPTPHCGSRSTTGAGRACRSSSAPGKNLPVLQTELRLVFRRPPRLGFDVKRRPGPDQLVVKLDPSTGIQLLLQAQCFDGAEPEQISLDMEFGQEGRELAAPYEVLLHAAMNGDSARFTRQDSVEETWRDPAAAARQPAAGARLRQGVVGAGPRRTSWSARLRRLATALDRCNEHSTVESKPRRRRDSPTSPQSAPRRRPSPRSRTTRSCPTATPVRSSLPMERSTGCACRASTRRACSARCSTAGPGSFRLGPFGINHPADVGYEPGTNTLLTTWKTPTGWILVRDALTMGPRRGEDQITPHTRPPADDDGDHMLVRTVLCLDGKVEVELVCEPVFDYGRVPAEWSLVGEDRHTADASGAGQTIRLQTDMAVGIEGDRVRARHVVEQGDQIYCALSWAEELAVAAGRRRGQRPARGDDEVLAWVARAGPASRPPLPRSDPALGARDQGAHLHAHRRDGGGAHDLPAGDAGRRAQLGLPLHLDAGLDLHAPGAALPQPRLGGGRVHAVRRRPRAERRRGAPDHVRDRRPPGPDRVDAGRPLGLRRGAARADRQRRVRPAPERRVRRGAGLGPAAHPPQRAAAAPAVADRAVPGGVRDERVARAGPGNLGGARQAAALRVLEAHVLGRHGPRGQARPQPRRHGV